MKYNKTKGQLGKRGGERKMGKNQWVVRHGNEWAVRGERNEKVTSVHSTQEEAEEIAKQIATNQKTEVIVQRKNGRIRSKDSFGNDPPSRKDMEH